ncbi:MAG: cellulose biosynthesis cyclic di-GMP-binding regulatory protein BcsB, partial [Leptolyngbyaceae cyanobacterium CSU_1_3]|nr:cellulose biosynthesis cyclic di-GMP-binding regulatory protein BcsB [Leptolyngbyaceae cyanobacterium CSU_1_3]
PGSPTCTLRTRTRPPSTPEPRHLPPAEPAPETPPEPEKKTAEPQLASTGPLSRYLLEFNRSPVIGNRFRLEGVYSEARLGFTRPKNWQVKSAQAIVHFQHSPALLANKSNLIVRVNDTSVGSVPLNLKQAQTGEAMVNIPANLLQDYNEITIVAQQQNSPTCSNPEDKSLWSEVLSDSKLVFDYQTQSIPLDFSRYPFPFFDNLGLDASRISYLVPSKMDESWLTASSRFQTQMGRLADFRPLETQLVKDLKKFAWNDRLVIIGTPETQPALKALKLPFTIVNNQITDGSKTPLPGDVGVLMLTTTRDGSVPVLIASGNSADGVAKAVQFLIQPQSGQIGTGQAILVNDLVEAPSPDPRAWSRYIPTANTFQLSDLKGLDNKPFKDVTVRGSSAPPVQVAFRALPDDRFLRGSSMNLRYSYSAQIDPKNSAIEVRIDGVGVGSKKLTSDAGATNEAFSVNLPENLIRSNSVIDVAFKLSPKQAGECGQVTDDQLWGTVHGDTDFNLRRENSIQLPDLKLMTTGFPFTAPQDLSQTAIVLPDQPSDADLMTLMSFSERMGRLSQANSVKLEVYEAGKLPESIKKERHLVGIGTRDRFPLKEVFESEKGFRLLDAFTRQSDQARIQSVPDNGGVIKSILSPWNGDRVLVGLSGQEETGLKQVQDILSNDLWFYQLKDDTVLVSATQQNLSPYDSNAYQLQFLQTSSSRRIEDLDPLAKARRFLQDHWYLLPTGIIALSLVLYGVAQLYLKRVAG